MRFREKGYNLKELECCKNKVSVMDRDSLLTNAKPRKYKGELTFITGFHRQYKEVENIFKKHWPILLKDKDLGPLLPIKPTFIYIGGLWV